MTSKLLTKGSGQILAKLWLLCLVCLNSHTTDLAFKGCIRRRDLAIQWLNCRQTCYLMHLVKNLGEVWGCGINLITFFSSFLCSSSMCLSSNWQ